MKIKINNKLSFCQNQRPLIIAENCKIVALNSGKKEAAIQTINNDMPNNE